MLSLPAWLRNRCFGPVVLSFPAFYCSSQYNTVRLYPARAEAQAYRQVSTEHYLNVDDNRALEYERGDRRAVLVLRSRPDGSAQLFVRLRVYPEDRIGWEQVEFVNGRNASPAEAQLRKRETESEEVTILETDDRMRTNPMVGNDVQAQSGYITFGKPAGAGVSRRRWTVLTLEIEASAALLETWKRQPPDQVRFGRGQAAPVVDLSEKQKSAWRRFSNGSFDEEAKQE